MSKSSGLGAQAFVQGYDLTNDIGQIDALENTRDLLDMTGLDKSGHERLHGLQSGRMAFTGFFNDAALQEHVALKLIPTTDVIGTVFKTAALTAVAAGLTGKRTNYGMTRGADGSLGTAFELQGNGEQLQYGLALTAGKRTDTTATNGTGVDFGTGSTTFGLVAYLHVFAFTGTSVTVTLQESSDNAVGDPYAAVTGGAFTAATGITAERKETSLTQTVERWLRAVTTGTFSSAQFAVMAKRYASANGER